jgi:hypothetical protein
VRKAGIEERVINLQSARIAAGLASGRSDGKVVKVVVSLGISADSYVH